MSQLNSLRDIAGPLLEPTIPAIRRLINRSFAVLAGAQTRFSSGQLPARSILRRLLIAADADAEATLDIAIRLAFGNVQSPSSTDFEGTGLLLPSFNIGTASPLFRPTPFNAALPLDVNWRLPDRPGRLLFEFDHSGALDIHVHLSLLVDSPIRVGE